MKMDPTIKQDISQSVARALAEDLGSGDITAQLIPADTRAQASIVCREKAIICGIPWVEQVFTRLDPATDIRWHTEEGATVEPEQIVCTLSGNARQLLSGERTALNFLQTLSGTATTARHFATLLEGSSITLLDTRKTLPGMRLAQKYAVRMGGGTNHRLGLYDAFLIKENHIAACGGIAQAIKQARQLAPGKPVEVEVENRDEFQQALAAGAERIMLDNFTVEDVAWAVASRGNHPTELEVSGNIEGKALDTYRNSGIDFISSGALTKHLHAIDYSMRIREIQ